jgi:thiol-disulfide isomerase/thioredoxin
MSMKNSASDFPVARPLNVSRWFNAPHDLTLDALRGRVVMVHAFQMLCPGCVMQGVPQAKRVAELFDPHAVAVIGLHSVFEHHAAMTPEALDVFIHEFRLPFPVGVDQPSVDGRIPETMRAYEMQGTPTTLLIDKQGRLRKQHFGVESDLALGAMIARLQAE